MPIMPELESVMRRPHATFGTPEDVKRVTDAASARLESMGIEVSLAAIIVQKSLQRLPDSSLGLSSRLRAYVVARSLHRAARMLDQASAHAAATYLVMCRTFAKEMHEEEDED